MNKRLARLLGEEATPDTRSVYEKNGWGSRALYFRHLAEEYNCEIGTVYALANSMGPGEDFDGLIVALEDL